ncbi:Hypothetical Protein OBI_RACECAR_283 [Arthrobacter phage Racecar]|nr:hypothetical protein PBI_RACECAR_75 [Arthrobacter phage Racecar]QFG12754.1 hypothetical protein PBI_MIMI_73 [Arthrobacter phage Mimi]
MKKIKFDEIEAGMRIRVARTDGDTIVTTEGVAHHLADDDAPWWNAWLTGAGKTLAVRIGRGTIWLLEDGEVV